MIEQEFDRQDFPLSEIELKILEERWAEYEKHPERAKTWEEVKAYLFRTR